MGVNLSIIGRDVDPEITEALDTVINKAKESWIEPEEDRYSEIHIAKDVDGIHDCFPNFA